MRLVTFALALALLATPLTADAQPAAKVYRIGWLGNAPYEPADWEAFIVGLRERGWVEGRNFTVEYRYSEGRNERFPALAAELGQGKPDLLVTGGAAPGPPALRAPQPTPAASATPPAPRGG